MITGETAVQSILSVSNLRVAFGQGDDVTEVVKGVDFILRSGSCLGIVGESGSGKSMTALSLMGLLPEAARCSADHIHYGTEEAKDLSRLSDRDMRHYRGSELSMIFQEPMTSLNPVLTCGFQVMEGLRVHTDLGKQARRQRVLELFEQVQLPDVQRIFRSYPHQISGGQKQRVMIAMAMSCEPRVLIADEPTTALDVTVQKAILDLLVSLQKERNLSLIFITHDLGVLAEIADEVLVMRHGEVVEYGEVETVMNNPQHAYTKGLLACRPPLQKRLHRLPVLADFDEGRSFQARPAQPKVGEGEPILQVRGLSTHFRRRRLFASAEAVRAVDNVSFEVHKGETLGLVGESGSGKTTLGRTMLRLVPSTSGEVWYNGVDLLTLPASKMRKLRRKVQIIFQDPYSSLNPRMRIGQAIAEPMLVHQLVPNRGQARERTIELLQRVGLDANVANRYPHEFSGGQRQRICIARALAVEPEFIVCDECVSALDVSVQAQVLNLLKDLQEEFNLTYIFITHDFSVVRFMADRIMVMKNGQIDAIDDGHRIIDLPPTDYTRRLIQAIPGQ